MMTVRYWAGARAAAGRAEEKVEAATVGSLLTILACRPGLAPVLRASSLLVDGAAAKREETERVIPAGAIVDILPPFAGG